MGRFIKLPQHKRFNYSPRFYDERKEAMDARIDRIKEELGIDDEETKKNKPYKSKIKGQIKYNFQQNRRTRKKSSATFILILFLLLLIAYYIFYA